MNEGSTSSTKTGTDSAIAGSKAALEAELNAQKAQLEGAAPAMVPPGGRWEFSLGAFLPPGECDLNIGSLEVGVIHTGALKLNFCSWGTYLQQFLYVAFALWAAWSIWNSVFSPTGKGAE